MPKISSKPCPICGGNIGIITADHPADSYCECQVCSATWSDGKTPEGERR
jgi:hypothetical protein